MNDHRVRFEPDRFLRQTAQIRENRGTSEGQARHERLSSLKTHITINISFSFM
jgi:hypothetical protein